MIKEVVINEKNLARFMSILLTVNCMAGLGFIQTAETVQAEESESTGADYFLQGSGTGEEFGVSDWDISTSYRENTTSIYRGDLYKARIVTNNHSGNNETVIRLVNGVELEGDVMYEEHISKSKWKAVEVTAVGKMQTLYKYKLQYTG